MNVLHVPCKSLLAFIPILYYLDDDEQQRYYGHDDEGENDKGSVRKVEWDNCRRHCEVCSGKREWGDDLGWIIS